jgi:hypothetical protein
VGNKNYLIDLGSWRGEYSLETHTSLYQGPATTTNGGVGYFTLYGQDTGLSNGGVLVHISSDFRGEYDALWHVNLTTVRYQMT